MAVYVDSMNAKFGMMIMCHMIADTKEELLEMADKIGVQRKWIQEEGTWMEHFDVSKGAKQKALANGAIEIGWREYALQLRKRECYPFDDKIENKQIT